MTPPLVVHYLPAREELVAARRRRGIRDFDPEAACTAPCGRLVDVRTGMRFASKAADVTCEVCREALASGGAGIERFLGVKALTIPVGVDGALSVGWDADRARVRLLVTDRARAASTPYTTPRELAEALRTLAGELEAGT